MPIEYEIEPRERCPMDMTTMDQDYEALAIEDTTRDSAMVDDMISSGGDNRRREY